MPAFADGILHLAVRLIQNEVAYSGDGRNLLATYMPLPTQSREPIWLRLKHQGFGAAEVLRHFGITSPPVDVFGIAAKMDVRFAERGPAEIDGAIGYRPGKTAPEAVIFVAKGQSAYRQRFTVAHELGHLLCGDDGKQYRDKFSSQGTNPQEIKANAFAADLLMPASTVRSYLRVYSPNLLHGVFHVSAEAMKIRLKMLALTNG